MTAFVTPPPLEPGDAVAVVSPASGLAEQYPHVYERGIERLQSTFDLDPVEFPTARKSDEYLAAHPAERAADIENAFADPEIRGVVATVGGNDQIRVLKHLDGSVLRDNPTRFFGISDNTNLAHALWNEGVVSFYGGHLLTEFAAPGALPEYLESSLRSALFDDAIGQIQSAPTFTDQDLDWEDPSNLEARPEMESNPGWTWEGGSAPVEGRTWGGSLEITYLQLAVDRYLPSPSALDGAVLLLETSEELPSPAVVKRALLGMGERGILARFDGVLLGRVKARSHLVERSNAQRIEYRERIRDVVTDVVTEYNETAPIVLGVDFGHTNPVVPVPHGGVVSIDPRRRRITFPGG
jgi:muramoyltetrapeptide carboxypeptidase LdcA involved in peptidoglycan recycling